MEIVNNELGRFASTNIEAIQILNNTDFVRRLKGVNNQFVLKKSRQCYWIMHKNICFMWQNEGMPIQLKIEILFKTISTKSFLIATA